MVSARVSILSSTHGRLAAPSFPLLLPPSLLCLGCDPPNLSRGGRTRPQPPRRPRSRPRCAPSAARPRRRPHHRRRIEAAPHRSRRHRRRPPRDAAGHGRGGRRHSRGIGCRVSRFGRGRPRFGCGAHHRRRSGCGCGCSMSCDVSTATLTNCEHGSLAKGPSPPSCRSRMTLP
jgi:hypothetical protein